LLTDFIERERKHYADADNNRFASAMSQPDRYYRFLQIIYSRYTELAPKFVSSVKSRMATDQPPADYAKLLEETFALTTLLHLEYESLYLFANIFMDRVANFIEIYFDKADGASICRHSLLVKNYEKYGRAKGLAFPDGFAESTAYLERELSEFRDKEIAHDKSPRAIYLTAWGADGEPTIGKTRLYPTATDTQVQGAKPSEVMAALEKYVERVIALIETNRVKSRYRLKAVPDVTRRPGP
jgi:hypothetical protein